MPPDGPLSSTGARVAPGFDWRSVVTLTLTTELLPPREQLVAVRVSAIGSERSYLAAPYRWAPRPVTRGARRGNWYAYALLVELRRAGPGISALSTRSARPREVAAPAEELHVSTRTETPPWSRAGRSEGGDRVPKCSSASSSAIELEGQLTAQSVRGVHGVRGDPCPSR